MQFIERLKLHFGADVHIITAASGTAAIEAALLHVTANTNKGLCMLPAYTFIASALAITRVGLEPYLLDINENWELTPDTIRNHDNFNDLSAILLVAAYGKLPNLEPWHKFQNDTGIPVVVDASACFDTVDTRYLNALNNIILTISLHATKAFGVGEGGLVITSKNTDINKIGQRLNFGFLNSRLSTLESFNGKMSEYHAAVGLAGLDAWKEKLIKLDQLKLKYNNFAASYNISEKIHVGKEISSAYALCSLDRKNSYDEIKSSGIDVRKWYGLGIHSHPFYKDICKENLTITNTIAQKLIGIPMHLDLNDSDIEFIVKIISEIDN